MSHILIKKVQDNLITPPASNYVKIFSNLNDGGLLYYVDSSGVSSPISGEVSSPILDTTYSNLYSLYQSSGFATGSYYNITDFDSVYDQPDFYFDGSLKTSLTTNGKPAIPYQPIVVMATSYNTLCPDAYQPYYPKDTIKYDITWRHTESGVNAKGRITERVDSNGNRTDYDHRTIRFKRYQTYDRTGTASGTITSWDCISGSVSGSSTQFNIELSIGDIILLDSDTFYGGDKNYTIGLKVKTIIDNLNIEVEVDSLYSSGVPATVTLNNNISQIIPTNYSFTGKNYTFHNTTPTGDFSSYKEVYFGQSDDGEFDGNVFTFKSTAYGSSILPDVSNNYIGNYSQNYLRGSNNTLILSNNVFIDESTSLNKIGNDFYNNHFNLNFLSNNISDGFYNNIINGDFTSNIIYKSFYENIMYSTLNNTFFGNFHKNITSYNDIFRSNFIKCDVFGLDLKDSSHIYGGYNCEIFTNSNLVVRLSFYDSSDTLIIPATGILS
jgi:hypothetical protein